MIVIFDYHLYKSNQHWAPLNNILQQNIIYGDFYTWGANLLSETSIKSKHDSKLLKSFSDVIAIRVPLI